MTTHTKKQSAPLFAERLAAVPRKPGIYMMRGTNGKVLYVGKSSSLRNRLRSYFSSSKSLVGKTRDLVAAIKDFEYIVTESEQEALLLENSLIKKHQPRFNVRLKDDKTYPYIKVDLSEDFPRVYITRRTANDGSRYFGPFASAGSVRKTLDLLNRLFPYRTCTKAITGTDERPCLEFHIKRCNAPCTGYASKAEYRDVIDQVLMFLDGNTNEVVREIKSAMGDASEALEFERAAALRDRLKAIERVYEGQKVVGMGRENLDAIALATAHDEAWVEIFFIRRGNLVGRDHFIMQGTRDSSKAEVVGQFVQQFYDSASYIPRTVLIPEPIDDAEILEGWLAGRREGPVSFATPQRGAKRRLVEMVTENAGQGLKQLEIKMLSNDTLMQSAMTELEEQLNLPRTPRRIECYDISHIQGTNVVASMSVFIDGKPNTSQYRRFRMKHTQNNDDFASMKEVLERRFKRLAAAEEARAKGEEPDNGAKSFGETPDLVLIDGGKGQLSSAQEVMLQMGVIDVPLASLAKKEEEIFLPDSPEPVVLPRNSQALFLVQRARDEAHRFAVTYHRNLRSKSSTQSALDLVPGVGPKRKRDLVRKFGSVQGVREADVDQLASTPGMTRKLAEKIKEYLG